MLECKQIFQMLGKSQGIDTVYEAAISHETFRYCAVVEQSNRIEYCVQYRVYIGNDYN